MKDLKEIYEEVHKQCNKDGCKSVPNITTLSNGKSNRRIQNVYNRKTTTTV